MGYASASAYEFLGTIQCYRKMSDSMDTSTNADELLEHEAERLDSLTGSALACPVSAVCFRDECEKTASSPGKSFQAVNRNFFRMESADPLNS